MNNKMIVEIADYYGLDAQSNQAIEEMAELIQALNKLRRAKGVGQATVRTTPIAIKQVIEEIADVEVMLDQLKHLLEIDPAVLESAKRYKLERTLSRIYSAEEG